MLYMDIQPARKFRQGENGWMKHTLSLPQKNKVATYLQRLQNVLPGCLAKLFLNPGYPLTWVIP